MSIGSPAARDYSIDNIRFLLIFSVVFAHLLEVSAPFFGKGMIYKFIYSFHMPIFLFLFGYNVKYSLKQILYRWCIPYVVFQCAYILFAKYVLNADVDFEIATPYWLLWYMLVCIYYQLLLPMFDTADKHRQILAIVCVFILSLLAGFVHSLGYYMSLSRFFVFQPWFVLGYYCKKNDVFHQFVIHPKRRTRVLVASAIIITVLMPFVWTIPDGVLLGAYSYLSCDGTMWMRAVVWAMSFSVMLFLFVGGQSYLNKKLILITNIGQNTWPIFLLHGFIIKAVDDYFPHLVGSPWSVILLSCIILLLIGNKLCNKAVYFASFSWLEKFRARAALANCHNDKSQ